MTKIDIDKFVASLMGFSPQQSMKYIKALADQGLKYKDGEIVEIEQAQPYNKPLFFEKGKWYTCIAKVDGFKVGHTYQSKMDGTVSNDSGAMYMYHNDVNLIFRPATETEVEVEKRGELRKWLDFGKTHEGMTIIIPKDLKGTDTDGGVVGERGEQGEQPTEEEMVGMGELGKVWHEQAIIINGTVYELVPDDIVDDDPCETCALCDMCKNVFARSLCLYIHDAELVDHYIKRQEGGDE